MNDDYIKKCPYRDFRGTLPLCHNKSIQSWLCHGCPGFDEAYVKRKYARRKAGA